MSAKQSQTFEEITNSTNCFNYIFFIYNLQSQYVLWVYIAAWNTVYRFNIKSQRAKNCVNYKGMCLNIKNIFN